MDYTVEHITQENRMWYAEIRKHNPNGTSTLEHTGNLWGWKGMTYGALRCMIAEYYNINLPDIKELNLIKKTECRKIYVLN